MSYSWRCRRIKTSRCFLYPSSYLSALSYVPLFLLFTTLLIYLPFILQSHGTYRTPCCEFWHLSDVCLSILSQDLGAHGQPINHSVALSPAELSQSQVIGFDLNVMCQSVNEWMLAHIFEQDVGCMFLGSCAVWMKEYKLLTSCRAHSYLPFPMVDDQ